MDLIWEQVVVDAHDPVALGRWWAEALGWVVVGDAAEEFEIRPTPDRVPGLLFVPVPEEKAGKNRLHLDFRPVDQTAEVERLLSLGARRADVGQRDASWVVLADPEGNEFCILRGRVRPDSQEPATQDHSPLRFRDLGATSAMAVRSLGPPTTMSFRPAIGYTEDVPLDLIETRTFGSRVIYERYGRVRDESE